MRAPIPNTSTNTEYSYENASAALIMKEETLEVEKGFGQDGDIGPAGNRAARQAIVLELISF